MSASPGPTANQYIKNAERALRSGRRLEARGWAARAAQFAPYEEEPWLMLAALASPRASLEYLKRALEINPHSARAREGMRWAIRRARAKNALPRRAAAIPAIMPQPVETRRLILLPLALGALAVAAAILGWLGGPTIARGASGIGQLAAMQLAQLNPTATSYSLPTPTFTPTPTETATPSPTATNTATPIPTNTAQPTLVPSPVPTQPPPTPVVPQEIGGNEHWIDVDLTRQRVTAYKGSEEMRSFLVSTGTWLTPTVVGQFNIYVRYESALMYGPDYYLPNVPYVMYFYKGYGLHGTYWHNNFGTPMSHGCVNLRTEDAEWLFNFSDLGTLVNVHY